MNYDGTIKPAKMHLTTLFVSCPEDELISFRCNDVINSAVFDTLHVTSDSQFLLFYAKMFETNITFGTVSRTRM